MAQRIQKNIKKNVVTCRKNSFGICFELNNFFSILCVCVIWAICRRIISNDVRGDFLSLKLDISR